MKKNGFKISDILLLDVSNFPSILRLHNQIYKCHSCNKKFFDKTNIVNDRCFISNQVEYSIALYLKNKISEKDIAKDIMFLQILLKESLILIIKVKNYTKIIYQKYYLMMNLNQLNQPKVL